MGVYFALRTHYTYPTGKYLRYFPDDTSVLEWFQKRWRGVEDEEIYAYVQELLGTKVYGFGSLFAAIAEHELPVPQTSGKLSKLLQEHLYVEGEIRASEHVIQVLTDDDELELAYYFFDDEYLRKNGDKAAYLLHTDFELPEDVNEKAPKVSPTGSGIYALPSGKGDGATYCALLSFYDSSNLTDLEKAFRIRGVRLPELTRYLATLPGSMETPYELQILRALTAFKEHTSDTSLDALLRRVPTFPAWEINGELYESLFGMNAPVEDVKILEEVIATSRSILQADVDRSEIQATPHMTQLRLYTGSWDDTPLYQRWIFFDDLWLNTHPTLGKSIFRFAARWDVLT